MLKDPVSAHAAKSHCYFLIESESGRIQTLFFPSPGQCFDFKLVLRLLSQGFSLWVGKKGVDPAVKDKNQSAFRSSFGS